MYNATQAGPSVEPSSPPTHWWSELYMYLLDLGLLMLSALFSGLNLGLLKLDAVSLEVISAAGSPKEQESAKRILSVRKNSNLLLCTLLLGNVTVNSLIAILMADMTSGLLGLLLSTVLITLFGEIFPQAVCTRYALKIGATLVPMVQLCKFLLYPIAKPISLLLDFTLGRDVGVVFDKREMASLLQFLERHEGVVTKQETKLMTSALVFTDATVADVMTSLSDVVSLDADSVLDEETKTLIWNCGHSRIPVFETEPDNFIGVLFVKDVILVPVEENLSLRKALLMYPRPLYTVLGSTKLPEVLKSFKSGKQGHLAVVQKALATPNEAASEPRFQTIGIVTLEDVLEKLIQDEIVDEMDLYVHVERRDVAQQLNRRRLLPINCFASRPSTVAGAPLTEQEGTLIASYLRNSCPSFSLVFFPNVSAICALVLQATVVEFYPHPHHERLPSYTYTSQASEAVNNSISAAPSIPRASTSLVGSGSNTERETDYLYSARKASDVFSLVLCGVLEVVSGVDNFVSYCGPWTWLGERALTQENASGPSYDCSFLPDFTARASRHHLTKVLQVSHSLYHAHVVLASRAETLVEPRGSREGENSKDSKSSSTSVEQEAYQGHVDEEIIKNELIIHTAADATVPNKA